MLKRIMYLIFIIFIFGLISGCGSSSDSSPQKGSTTPSTETKVKQPSKTSTAANNSQSTAADNSVNSSAKNYSDDNTSYTALDIRLFSEADLSNIIDKLIKLGYLTGKAKSEAEFTAAISKFQKDQGLKASGEITAETLQHLNTAGKNK